MHSVCVFSCLDVCTYVRIYVCMYVCMCVSTYVRMYVSTYVRTHVHTHAHVRTYVCMYVGLCNGPFCSGQIAWDDGPSAGRTDRPGAVINCYSAPTSRRTIVPYYLSRPECSMSPGAWCMLVSVGL